MLESARFFAERWLLFYNQDTQHALVQKIGLGQWDDIKLLQVFIASLVLMVLLAGIWYFIREQQEIDPLLVEYYRLQQEMRRFNVVTHPPATLATQLHELALKQPRLKESLVQFSAQYEQLRLQQVGGDLGNREIIRELVKSLRMRLKNIPTELTKNST